MPRTWIYFIALVLPLAFSLVVLYSGLAEWLWYRGDAERYYLLAGLRENDFFREFLGGWALPVFTGSVFAFWLIDYDDEAIAAQFLLLPLVYAPFSIIGAWLANWHFDVTLLFIHPLVVIPVGYLYVFPWVLFVAVFARLRLVV